MKYTGLVDCNNFFVSCERLFRPDLWGKPTVVLSSNDGCVVARSQEVKDMGIPMGVPHFKVRDEFKKSGVTVFSSNFKLYRDISRRVMEVLEAEVGKVEQYSVDEAFFALDATPETIEDALRAIKQRIEQCVGVPVSVGAAKTKTIAKAASEKEKKGAGICVLTGATWQRYTTRMAIDDVWGIGGKTGIKCHEAGIRTVADYLATDRSRIEALFGVSGMRLHSELREQPVRTLGEESSLQQSIMSTRSFKEATTDVAVLQDSIAYHIAHAAEELRELGAVAQSLRVLIRPSRHGDWALRGGTKEYLFTIPTNDTRAFLEAATSMLSELYEPGVPYKKAGVVLSLITGAEYQAMDLFADTNEVERSGVLMRAIDTLNSKYGNGTLTLGRTGKEAVWRASTAYVSPQYTTEWNHVALVRA